jgi:molybdenum cofactor cytidylyltransferase
VTAAIVLAAGASRRMGQPKMLLPWGAHTVIEHVTATFEAADVQPIVVVTGGEHDSIQGLLARQARVVFNPAYAQGEMLSSLQCGLAALESVAPGPEVRAAFIALGDQPQVQVRTIQSINAAFRSGAGQLIVPSYDMHRGHPWLVGQGYWAELRAMRAPATPRDFLERHQADIQYVIMDTRSVLEDLDTPQDYEQHRPPEQSTR